MNFFTNSLQHLSKRELMRSELIFRLMNSPYMVKILSGLTVKALKIGLPVKSLIKQTIYKQFCGGETIDDSKKVVEKLGSHGINSILDYSVEGGLEDKFDKTVNEITTLIALAANNKNIPYTCLKMTGIAHVDLLTKISDTIPLTHLEDLEHWQIKKRLEKICSTAHLHTIPLYIDAEESWVQEAIDKLTLDMMMKYNTNFSLISTTLQMYRKDRLEYLKMLLECGRKKHFKLGVKLVRGAYWEKEISYANERNYPIPVYETKEEVDHDFEEALKICVDNLDIVTVCAGTHNEDSLSYLIEYMKEKNIPKNHPNIYFSQLYGMSDNISYQLANQYYNVSKYLPYGPVKSVIPYLIRRAEENTSIAGQMGRELQLILEEKQKRRRA